jgi:hypothetical protein
MWQQDAFHPSLHFKKVGGDTWSVRVGIHHRALGRFQSDRLVWMWIGTHAGPHSPRSRLGLPDQRLEPHWCR